VTRERSTTCDEVRDLAAGFVLGALEPAESRAVREHLATCPEAHRELAELGGVVPYLNESLLADPVEPPASLRDRVLASAAAELPAAAAQPAARIPFRRPAAAARRGAGAFDWALRIAAVVAIVALAGWNLLLQGRLDAARDYEVAVSAVVEAAGEPGAMTVILTPTDGEARGIAAVRVDGSVVLAARNLGPTSGSQVYETWVIVGDTGPVAVGSFTVGSDGTGTFTTRPADAPPGSVIALTLEPNAGNTAPLGPIVASGVAIAPTS
jgi:hypothetical protein